VNRKGVRVGLAAIVAIIAFLVLASIRGPVGIIARVCFCVFLAALLIALIWAAGRDLRRVSDTSEARTLAEARTPEGPKVEIEPNVGGIGLAIAAVVLAIVSLFLPELESTSFLHIAHNTQIQNGGWLILGCSVGILGAVYRVYSKRTTTWTVFVLGLIILGSAIYAGTGSRTKLESVGSIAGESVVVHGSPAIGIYASGAAGLIAMFAGLILAGHVFDSYKGAERLTKSCPDCAETVMAAARVCKHCGHQFDAAAAV
jgi:Uncharacterised protein family UPF0547